jgi:hypothetical protein
MHNLCYIQARGGSKRFPGKNVALWNGIPMVADAIKKAALSNVFDAIMVTSDSPIILDIAARYGAIPIWRTEATASDTATDDDVAREILGWFPVYDIVCKLYPCVPLLEHEDLTDAVFDLYSGIPGIYSVDETGKDAGAYYVFRMKDYRKYNTLALDKFPWEKKVLEVCQDINTFEDYMLAKEKGQR